MLGMRRASWPAFPEKSLRGSGDCLNSVWRPDESNPRSKSTRFCGLALLLEPRRQHCKPVSGKRKCSRSWRQPGRPEPIPDVDSGEKKESMKGSKSLFLGLALLLATSAFAANKGSLQVQEPINVNGTKLAPGDYKVQWDGAGPNVEMSILKGKNVVTKVPAHIVDLGAASPSDAAVVKNNGDGTKSLSEVRLNGRKFALAVGEEAAKADATK